MGLTATSHTATLPRPWQWAVLILGAGLMSCSDPSADGQPSKTGSSTPSAVVATCVGVGPLACQVVPVTELSKGCDQLRHCLSGKSLGDETIRSVPGCAPPTPLTGKAGRHANAAVMPVDLQVDGPPAHAAFLMLDTGAGWCPADTTHLPAWNHGGHCSLEVNVEWQEDAAASHLAVHSARTCRMPLDQAEFGAGESDVAFQECSRGLYRVDGARLVVVSKLLDDGPCRD